MMHFLLGFVAGVILIGIFAPIYWNWAMREECKLCPYKRHVDEECAYHAMTGE